MAAEDGVEGLLAHFRAALRADPVTAYRDWFRAQEELTESGHREKAQALADDLWSILPSLCFDSSQTRARFFHNVAVFFGTPGPAASLLRARDAFSAALTEFAGHEETGWRARALHNFATALSNLGQTAADLEESVALFGEALAWRTTERSIARGVTLHNLGIALRRLAELDPERSRERLEASVAALREAVAIREAHGLAEGRALSLFHMGLTLEALQEIEEARCTFASAADQFERLGKSESAAIARSHIGRENEEETPETASP